MSDIPSGRHEVDRPAEGASPPRPPRTAPRTRLSPADGDPGHRPAAVVSVTAALLFVGDLARVAALTDAAVLGSFLLVNLSLPCLAARRRTDARGLRRTADLVLPVAAVLLCTWLLVHTDWTSVGTAAVLAGIALLVARSNARPG